MAAIVPFLDRTKKTEDTGTPDEACPIGEPPGGPLPTLEGLLGRQGIDWEEQSPEAVEGYGIDYRSPSKFPKTYDLAKDPTDFTTLMHQHAQHDLGVDEWAEVPKIHPVVAVAVASLYEEAKAMEWDERGPEHVEALMESIRAGVTLPPVVIGHLGAPTKGLIDGRHRVLASHALGLKVVPAIDLDAPAWTDARRPGHDQFAETHLGDAGDLIEGLGPPKFEGLGARESDAWLDEVEEATQWIEDNGVTTVDQAWDLLSDDRSHGDEYIGSAADTLKPKYIHHRGREAVVQYVADVFSLAKAGRINVRSRYGDFGVVRDVPELESSHAELTRTAWIRRGLEEELLTGGKGGGPRDFWVESDCKSGELYFHLDPAMQKDILPWYVGVGDVTRFALFGSNGKMKCPTWDLPAGAPSIGGSCPGATAGQTVVEPEKRKGQLDREGNLPPVPGLNVIQSVDERRAICQNCYALEGNYPSPHVQVGEILRYWWTRSMLAEGRGEEWVETMVRAVGALNIPRTRQGIRPIRVHSAGDFFSPQYAEAWMEVANRVWDLEVTYGRTTPEIRFWAPTRTWAAKGFDWDKIANRLSQPNMIVRASSYHVDDPAPGMLTEGWPMGATSIINDHNRGMAPEFTAPLAVLAEDGAALAARLQARGPVIPPGANEKQRKAAQVAHERELGAARAMISFAKVEAARDRSTGHDTRFEWSCQTYAIDARAKGADLSHSCEDAAAPDGKIGCRACWTHPQLRVNYTTH